MAQQRLKPGHAEQHFFTSRKVADGLGAGHTGTAAHWSLTVSAVALALLTPFVIGILGAGIGHGQAAVIAFFGRPLPAILLGLFLVVGMTHWIRGTRIMIDDYVHGAARRWALIAVHLFGWLVIAAGLYALARMALIGVVV